MKLNHLGFPSIYRLFSDDKIKCAFTLQVITALGKTWHPEHFTCTHCNQELGTRNFFEREGHPYCEPDYHNLFSPRCAYCNGPILDVRRLTKSRAMFRSISGVASCFRSSRILLFSEMCNRFGKNLAYGTLLLRSVWQTIWGRGIPRAGRKAVLP